MGPIQNTEDPFAIDSGILEADGWLENDCKWTNRLSECSRLKRKYSLHLKDEKLIDIVVVEMLKKNLPSHCLFKPL